MKIKISLNSFKNSLQKLSASDDVPVSMDQVPANIKEVVARIKSQPVKINKSSVVSFPTYSFYYDDFYADPSVLTIIAQAKGFLMMLGGFVVVTFATNK